MHDATDTLGRSTRTVGDARAVWAPLAADTTARRADWGRVAHVHDAVDAQGRPTLTSESTEIQAYSRARGREAAVSGYGASATPEGYAEAYALYQRDPQFMHDHFPSQYGFFHSHHLSANDHVPPPARHR